MNVVRRDQIVFVHCLKVCVFVRFFSLHFSVKMNSTASVKFHFNMPGMHEKLISAVHDIYRGNYSTLFFFLIIIVILLYSFFLHIFLLIILL